MSSKNQTESLIYRIELSDERLNDAKLIVSILSDCLFDHHVAALADDSEHCRSRNNVRRRYERTLDRFKLFQRQFACYLIGTEGEISSLANQLKALSSTVVLESLVQTLVHPNELSSFLEFNFPIVKSQELYPIFERLIRCVPNYLALCNDSINNAVQKRLSISDGQFLGVSYSKWQELLPTCRHKERNDGNGPESRTRVPSTKQRKAIEDMARAVSACFTEALYSMEYEFYVISGMGIGSGDEAQIDGSVSDHATKIKELFALYITTYEPEAVDTSTLMKIADIVSSAYRAWDDHIKLVNAGNFAASHLEPTGQKAEGFVIFKHLVQAIISEDELRRITDYDDGERELLSISSLFERIIAIAHWHSAVIFKNRNAINPILPICFRKHYVGLGDE